MHDRRYYELWLSSVFSSDSTIKLNDKLYEDIKNEQHEYCRNQDTFRLAVVKEGTMVERYKNAWLSNFPLIMDGMSGNNTEVRDHIKNVWNAFYDNNTSLFDEEGNFPQDVHGTACSVWESNFTIG